MITLHFKACYGFRPINFTGHVATNDIGCIQRTWQEVITPDNRDTQLEDTSLGRN
jgi:hypothetical protein